MFKRLLSSNDHLIQYKILGLIASIVITAFVLFYPPMPGVADQGDFQRVMTVTGLEQIKDSIHNPDLYWFKYVTTEYNLLSTDLDRLKENIPTTSMIYPIALAKLLCTLLGMQYFSTKVLAFVYAIVYIICLYICFRAIPFKNAATAIFFILLALLILMDGNYLVWFNSLYGEPMMSVSLLAFIASVLYLCKHIKKIKILQLMFVFVSAFLFLGAKMQCFVALPFLLMLLFHIILLQNRKPYKFKIADFLLIVFTFFLISYVGGIYKQINATCGVDTQYNSVFYGILKNSISPEKDLAALGLSPDLAVDAGKHAYLPKDEYVKYVPWSALTRNELNKKVTNFKLLRFYLSQPTRLLQVMEYTASQCFNTGGWLGKYEKSALNEYTPTLKRFTLWSNFRNTIFPKNLVFLIFFYLFVISISILQYIKSGEDTARKLRIELLWLIMLIGIIQFPMPYIGNGEADTAKQLFLFNYTFDITFLVCCTWVFDKLFFVQKWYCKLIN